jgi:MFS family permease
MSKADSETPEADDQPASASAPRAVRAVSWEAFLSTYLPALVLALGTGIALPAIPTLAMSFGVSFGVASGVVTAFLLGNLAGTIPSGWLIDRFGRRPVLLAGPILSATMACGVALSDSFPEILVLRFFNGVAAQMWLMARLAAISHGTAAGQRGRQVSWMFGMDSTGKLSGPLIGGFVATAFGLRAPFWIYAALAALSLIPTILYAENTPPRKRDSQATGQGALKALTVREIVMSRLPYFGVALFAGLTRGPVYADLLHLYAAFAYGLGPSEIGYLATGASIISLPVGFIAGWMMDRFGRKHTMVPGFSGCALAMTLLGVSAFLHVSLAWYVALFFFGILMQSLTGGSVQTVGADVAPPQARGTFLGLWRFTGQGGATVSPIIFALLSDHVSYGSAFLFVAASAACVAFLLVRYVPETRKSD